MENGATVWPCQSTKRIYEYAILSATDKFSRSTGHGMFDWTALYGQRSQNETVDSRHKRKYGAFVGSRHWWEQFRELTIARLRSQPRPVTLVQVGLRIQVDRIASVSGFFCNGHTRGMGVLGTIFR